MRKERKYQRRRCLNGCQKEKKKRGTKVKNGHHDTLQLPFQVADDVESEREQCKEANVAYFQKKEEEML